MQVKFSFWVWLIVGTVLGTMWVPIVPVGGALGAVLASILYIGFMSDDDDYQ